ncbi:MAG: glycosyltransferase [Halofilum sp. (in: g-proteobacteria)]
MDDNSIRNPPDIAIFGDWASAGGVSRRLTNQIRVWDELGYTIELVAFRDGVKFYPDEQPDALRFKHLGTRTKWATLVALWWYLRRSRPTVVLSASHLANIIVAACAFLPGVRARRYLSVPNTVGQAHRKTSQRKLRKKAVQVRLFYPCADGVVAVSEGVKQDLIDVVGLKGVDVQVIYNGTIAPLLFERARELPPHAWFQTHNLPVIVAVGRLSQQKDYSTLIRAFSRVRKVIRARLVIVGEGKDRGALEALVGELHLEADVALPGFAENPYAWIAHADVFTLSSRWEGLVNVVIEALALGVPIVSTDCPSGPREILDGGRYGELVPVGDYEELAAALVRALQDKTPGVDRSEGVKPFFAEYAAREYLRYFQLDRPVV